MSRNRGMDPSGPPDASVADGHPLGTLLTLLLLAPAAAVLAAALHHLVDLDRSGAGACVGSQAVRPVLEHGLPAAVLLFAIPAALLSLAHRGRGWMWLAGALVCSVMVHVALGAWMPPCG